MLHAISFNSKDYPVCNKILLEGKTLNYKKSFYHTLKNPLKISL